MRNIRLQVLPCAVPEMKNFYNFAVSVISIIDLIRAVKELADPWLLGDQCTYVRESLQYLKVTDQGFAQSARCLRVVSCDVADDLAEVA
jgi:hypothetical protein